MAGMNPLRDDGLAAQERVFQLERELKEKNELIYKLQNPKPKKPKQPRKPINWPAWLKKTAKTTAYTAGILLFLLFCVIFFECSSTYVAKGKIIEVFDKVDEYGGTCKQQVNEDGKLYTPDKCTDKKLLQTGYGIKVEFEDRYNGRRIIQYKPLATDSWPMTAEVPPFDAWREVEFGSAIPYVGCDVIVYYPLGRIFKDRLWDTKPRIDARMCQKPAK